MERKLEPPYCLIKKLPFDPQGWFVNQQPLIEILKSHKIRDVIEIGSWLGSSTRFFAENLAEDGHVYAIDTWLGSIEHEGDEKLPNLFQQFLSNMIHLDLAWKITPIRLPSLEAAQTLPIRADLVYVDASHERADVYNDIMHWYPHLNEKGVMCGDDWNWESVKEGVIDAAFELKQETKTDDNFWWFEPL